jgi:hypothetical protein
MFNADREAKAQLDFLRAAREEIAFSELCSSKTNIELWDLAPDSCRKFGRFPRFSHTTFITLGTSKLLN